MFIRLKKNASGSISVQILQKQGRNNQLIKTIGSTKDAAELLRFRQLALEYIDSITGQLSLSFGEVDNDKSWFGQTMSSIKGIDQLGASLILGKLYNQIGFDKLSDTLLKELVISRIMNPSSKLRTTRYLSEYHYKEYSVDRLYRLMDHLENNYKSQVEQISYEHSLSILEGVISMVFYDVTTIYFEADKEDELRKSGFSKEGKHKHPQVVLGLLVSIGGYPLAYQLFPGNQYEGRTMLPIIEAFKTRFNLDKIIVIADSGLMNKTNIEELQNKGYEYILGARIKNESKNIQQQILSGDWEDGKCVTIKKSEALSLIVSYSNKRAKKDSYNRKRGLERLEKSLKKGKLTKSNINNRGYNKYLKMEGQINITIDYSKFEKDSRWDGLKGYLTNTKMKPKILIDNYNELWKIEKAFRITKTDLKIRPIYHRKELRIKAHICLAFIAYKVYKELERQLDIKDTEITVERAIEIMKTLYGVKLKHPITKIEKKMLFANNEMQKELLNLFQIEAG